MSVPESITGKTVLITGSTDGLGKLIAEHLAMKGAKVLLHGRNPEKGKSVCDEFIRKTGNENLRYYNGDFTSLDEVKSLSEEIMREQKQIDILINNVGIGTGVSRKKREISKDGIELRFAVNYAAHVLLTEKLLPVIPSGTGEIINVASIGQAAINFTDLMIENNYEGYFAYRQSKTALIMYTIDLAFKLKEKGIKVNALHPATLMNTKMVIDEWGYTLTTVEQGAEAVENLIFTAMTGEYYDGIQLSKAIQQVYNPEAREKLHSITQKLLRKYL